jgi:hypothetical protein
MPGEWVGEVVSKGGEGIDIGRLFKNPGRESNMRENTCEHTLSGE